MACPWTAATTIASTSRQAVKPSWYRAISARKASGSPAAMASTGGSPGIPAGVNIARLRPAEKDPPSAARTTTRTVSGTSRAAWARASHSDGVWALSAVGLARVSAWTGPEVSAWRCGCSRLMVGRLARSRGPVGGACRVSPAYRRMWLTGIPSPWWTGPQAGPALGLCRPTRQDGAASPTPRRSRS